MYYKCKQVYLHIKLAAKELLLFFGITPFIIYFYIKSIIRLSTWQKVTVCRADIMCMITQPSEFVFVPLFISILCGYKLCRHKAIISFAIRNPSRINLYLSKLKIIAVNSICSWIWVIICTALISWFLIPSQINWQEYTSMFFRYNQTLSEVSFLYVFYISAITLLLITLTLNALFIVLSIATEKTKLMAFSVILIYFFDLKLPVKFSLLFQKNAVFHESFVQETGFEWHFAMQVSVLMLFAVFGAIAAKRKDML